MSDVGGVDCDVDGGVSDFGSVPGGYGTIAPAIKYAITPGKTPVNTIRKIKITRKIVGSIFMYSARPPSKPETFLFVVLLYNSFIE